MPDCPSFLKIESEVKCSFRDFESGSKTVAVAHNRVLEKKNIWPDVPDDIDNIHVNSEKFEAVDQNDYFGEIKMQSSS